MNTQRHQIDMTQGALASKIIIFVIPLIGSGILQLLFNAVDVMVVGRYVGKEALAAVGSNTSLINLMIALFMGLSVGANVVVARDMGAGRLEKVGRGAHTAIFLALCSGVILAIVGFFMAGTLLRWMSSPEDVIDLATVYLRIYCLGMPASMLYNFGSALLRVQGDTRRPLFYLLFSGIIHLVLNLIFVIVFHWDVAGVALGTIISQYISAALVLRCLLREDGPLHIELRQLRADPEQLKGIFHIGIPAGLQSILFSLSNVIIQSSINSFGSTVMSGNAAASSLEGFVYTTMNAFSQTALSFIGQNYGAGECKRVDRVAAYCLIFVSGVGIIFGNLVYLAGEPLLALYAPGQEEVIARGMVRLSINCRLYFLCGLMDVMASVLRGLGSSIPPMIVSMLGGCGLRVFWVMFIFPMNPTQENLYVSYPITWAITAGVLGIMFYFVRKRAYSAFGSPLPAYQRVEGKHPKPDGAGE